MNSAGVTARDARPQSNAAAWPRQDALVLSGIVAVAVVLRVAFWWFQARGGAVQSGDPEEYYRAALHLLQGEYYDTGKWIRPPLYPLFLTLLFLLGGVDTARAMLLQAIATGAGVLVFYAYSRQRFQRRDVAYASAIIGALFVPLASFGSAMFAEGLFVLLMVAVLALLDRAIAARRSTWRWAAVTGVVLALATLTRAVGLFFVPLAALVIWLFSTRSTQATPVNGSQRSARQLWRNVPSAAAVVLGFVLTIAPWTLRNYLVHDRLILIDTNGAISMWYGTVRNEADQQVGEARIFAVSNQADRQALALRMTAERVLADPVSFLARARFKIASLFILQTRNYTTGSIIGLDPRGQQVVFVEAEHPLWIALIADVQYITLMLLAIFGLCYAPKFRRTLPVLLFVAVSVFLSAVTIGHPRLRLPITSVLLPYAAFALCAARSILRPRREWRFAVGVLGCLAFFTLIFSTRYLPWARAEMVARSAEEAVARGNLAGAQDQYEQALAINPNNALRVLNLADLAVLQGDDDVALARYQEALQLEPRNVYAYTRQIQLSVRQGNTDLASAAQAAIASYGRDTNDVYRYTWGNPLTPPPTRIIPGAPDALGHYQGFAPATPDLSQGRWTLGKGSVRVEPTCGSILLRLRGPAGRVIHLAAEPLGVRQTLTLDGGEQVVRLTKPTTSPCSVSEATIVRIESATSLLDIDQAPWMTGVAVLEVTVSNQ